ncbi:MAG: sigma-70 family RNA polymerase sigma factor [Deltaproteobacteria bacterium]|nr:sigma-70 family RNA polymerase sigma factor [Deltaproteobacteria bacterium]
MEDTALVALLKKRDRAAFTALVERYQGSMKRVASGFVPSAAIADEVVQETWLAVLDGIDRFAERSSFSTWLFTILLNRAKTRGHRERRTIPFSALERDDDDTSSEPFQDHFGDNGQWLRTPGAWGDDPPEQLLQRRQLGETLNRAIASLPDKYRIVITLRDVEELDSNEVCKLLNISEANQRVILHRAHLRLRETIEQHLAEENRNSEGEK